MDPDVTWDNGTGCPLIVHYWADLQSMHRFRCYDNSAELTGYFHVDCVSKIKLTGFDWTKTRRFNIFSK